MSIDAAPGNALPSVSIVIEWENAKLSELDSTFQMLSVVSRQAAELRESFAEPPELVVVFDETTVDPALIRNATEHRTSGRGGVGRVPISARCRLLRAGA